MSAALIGSWIGGGGSSAAGRGEGRGSLVKGRHTAHRYINTASRDISAALTLSPGVALTLAAAGRGGGVEGGGLESGWGGVGSVAIMKGGRGWIGGADGGERGQQNEVNSAWAAGG